MCGIAGFIQTDGTPADEAVLARMITRLEHRGPDDRGTWTDGGVGLAHARLSILDPSPRGHQPFLTNDGEGVISYNGEVYNFRELRARLVLEGVRFTSETDTEVVLQGLHVWGVEAAVREFDGMFAFAYWDARTEHLWLGRDRLGIKPLYLHGGANVVAFASEMKGLLVHPAVPVREDLHALTTQMLRGRLTGTWTPFEGIESMLPGTVMAIDRQGRREVRSYFDILDDVDTERIAQGSSEPFAHAVERFSRTFEASVHSHLISDAPLAAMCSGGVDSSLITAMARDHKPDIVAYVADVKGASIREADRAERVCDHLGVELRHVPVDPNTYLRLLPHAVYHNDQPNFFPQNVAAMAIARAAHRDGFKVLLAGSGADELFGGYSWQVEAYRMWRLRRWHRRLIPNTRLFRGLGKWLARLQPLDLDELRARPFDHLSVPPDLQDRREGGAVALDGLQREVRAAALFKKLEGVGTVEEQAFLARSFEDIYVHLRTSLESDDKMGMSSSVEVRVPFLSSGVIDMGLHLPAAHKYRARPGLRKHIVKVASEARLPHDIVHATKVGFGTSRGLWTGALDLVHDGYVARVFKWGRREEEELRRRIRLHGGVSFRILALELWGRIFVQGESPDALADKLLSLQSESERAPG